MFRSDGSVKSTNTPSHENSGRQRDFGIYRGVIREVIYTDDERNDSGGNDDPNEVLYSGTIIGGDRDGQIFTNARVVRGLGGWANFEETILKGTKGVSGLDPADTAALADPSINQINKLNGDVVYIQYVGGNTQMPLIVGLAYHQSAADPEATKDDGPRQRRQYNGILTEVTKDGEFSWTKANGAYAEFQPNPDDPLTPYVNQFAPTPGQDQAVQVTLDNNFLLQFLYSTGLSVSVDGTKDEFDFTTKGGAGFTVSGSEDSLDLSSNGGADLKVDGKADKVTQITSGGAAATLDGKGDSFTASTSGGSSLAVDGKNGVTANSQDGNSLSLASGKATMKSAGAAELTLSTAVVLKAGGVDAFKDVVVPLLQSLSSATYAGFSAPGSNVADIAQLLVKAKLLTGG